MDTRKSRIREHQEAVDELALSVKRQEGELGRVLLEKGEVQYEELNEAFNKALETQNRLSSLEDTRNGLKDALDGKIETRDRIEELSRESEEQRKTRTGLYADIGRKGWNLFDNGDLEEEEFRTFFPELIERAREIEDKERQVRTLETERDRSSFLKKVSLTAKITMSRNQTGRLQNSMEELFSTAGEALVSSEKVEQIPDEEMQRYTSRLKDLEEKMEEREKEVNRLEKSLSSYEGRIDEICGEESPERKLKSLENELQEVQSEHFERLQTLGGMYLTGVKHGKDEDENIRTILDRIEDLESQKQKHQDEIHSLQAIIEKEELEGEIKKKEESLSRLEKKVQEQKKEIKSLKEAISNDKNRLADLNKITAGRSGEPDEELDKS